MPGTCFPFLGNTDGCVVSSPGRCAQASPTQAGGPNPHANLAAWPGRPVHMSAAGRSMQAVEVTACCVYFCHPLTRKVVAHTIVTTGCDKMGLCSLPSSFVGCCHVVRKPCLNTRTTYSTISSSNHEVDLQCAGPRVRKTA